ncbi:E3 ubiquitin-protein ligase DZIP3-like isoform X5 [Chiloscyllium plagiosum]|uniref:E3 ubiquitin-protein ligase DZIP3-like isoform X5 n=1 Tax=Chiloscyllium plagiosum TaxID=36176 RepID=UPI001CB85AC3|nr:E3 ubiquitin-protein ligase DZIP3-like isoform X5 [Chiloscyllium plagiosum]
MAAQGQKEDSVKMGPEAEEQMTRSEVKNDYVEESSRNNSLDIIEKLGFLQSMSTDEKIKQFQMFLTTALINDLVHQLSEVQYLLLLHYFVMALCSRGQAQDLSEAEKHIMAIRKMTKETPECQSFLYVAYHMLGCLYFKQNRFDEAMKWFQNSKQELEDNPPTIEWADLVLKSEEIEPKHFPIKINEYIEMCKCAPKPVATCQDSNCQGYYKREIYPTDPDYKGYVELSCDSYCLTSYHLTCWKGLKDSLYHGKSNQDFCSMKCLNSDCKGLIIKCVIHNASGIAQTEFEIKNSDLSSRISTIKREQKAVNTLEGLSKRNEQNECEKERKEKETDLLTDKCRLYREIILKRKLIENAIVETGKVTELIINWDLKKVFMEKSSEITAEMILNHVLRWNCNFKIRQFLMMLKDEDLSNHPELKKWITYILELGDQCSLCFLYSYKKVIIPILCDMENLLNFAQKLLSRKALSKEEVKVLALTPSEQRPDVLMEQVTSHKDVWQMGELVFALAEEQDRLPKLKPLFDEFNREFEKFTTGLPALTAPQETKQQTMEPTDLKCDDDSLVLKAKSKKKKKKSRSKKAQTNEDSRNITLDGVPHQCETLSIPVQENQLDDSRSNKQVADSSCDVSTFSAGVAASSRLVLGTVHNNNNAGPFLTSHEVNKLDDLPDQTYESDGELDETDNTLIDEESTGSSVCTSSDLCSSSSVGDGTINVQEHLWQNVKEKSEMRQKLLALQNENQALLRNLDQLITKLQEEQQQRTHAENQHSRLQEHYQLEISRVNQQLQSKDEEIKKIAAQFANERLLWNKDKAKLEDVTAKNIAKLVEATKRAIAAEILFLECRRDNGLFQLQQAEQDCSVRLRTAEENLTENPESAHLRATFDGWQAIVADIRNKIDFTKNQFDEQINLVKSGTKLNILPKIKIPPPPPHPDAVMKHFLEQHLQAKANDALTGFGLSKSLNGRLTNVPGQAETSAAVHEQVRGTIPLSEQVTSQQSLLTAGLMATPGGIRGKNSFERIMERLSTSYPHFTRGSLTDFLKEVRLSNGGSLSGLSYDEIVNKVAHLVESKLCESSSSGQNKPSNQFAWCSSRQQGFNSWEGARAMTEEQDPCVICHEELAVESMLVLPCAHKFHSQCIESWLNEQRTCPTCRLHVVLPQEFPDLPSRKIPPLWTAQKHE